MAGIRIDVDASKGISSLTDFRKALYDTGIAAKTSDKELGVIADRFRDKLQADRAEAALGLLRKQIEQVGRAAGLSQQEMTSLHNRMGTMQTGANQTGSALSSVASVAERAGLSMGGLATAALGAVTAYMTLKSAAELVAESIGNAARYETLGVVIQQVGKNAGYTKAEMLGFAEGVQSAGISMIASREALSKMATAQLDLSKSSELARIAQDAAVISGKNSSEAFERIVQGITNGQTVLLRHQGIMVDLDTAYKAYARQLGVTKDQLTPAQERQAALNAVLETGATRAGVYEAAMMTAGKQITSFQRYIEDFKTTLGTAFLDSFTDTVFNATDAMKLLQAAIAQPEAQQALGAIAEGIAVMANAIIASVPPAIDAISKLVNALVAAKAAISDYKNVLQDWFGVFGKGAGEAIDFMGQLGRFSASPLLSEMSKAEGGIKKVTGNKDEMRAQADAVSDYWAKWNAGVKEYNEKTASSKSIGQDSKNSKFLPIPQQVLEQNDKYKKQLEGISSAWKEAYDKGQWKDVEAINRSAAVATGQHADALDKLDAKANRGRKSAAAAANASARYESQAAQALQQYLDQYDQLQATIGGDSLGAKLAAIDKKYNSTAATLERSMIGAKGSTEEVKAALDQLAQNKALEVLIAQSEAWRKSMQDAANMLGELGRLSGDPQAVYGSQMTTAKLWEADQAKRIGAIQDETEREKQLGELRQVMALKELDAKKTAYAGVKAVSSEYWNAEAKLIEANLATVKANAEDETAYKIYAAQQWDEFYKAQMEQQAATAGSFAETLAAKWSLAFGGYKSETTKTKESWDSMADSIISSTNGMIDGIAGGFGDLIRNIGNGTASIEDLWRNMLSRMLDAFASFVEQLIKDQLKDLLAGMFSGSGSGSKSEGGFNLLSLLGGAAQSSSSGGSAFDTSATRTIAQAIGKETGDTFTKTFANNNGALSVNFDDIPDVGKEFAKATLKESEKYGTYGTYDAIHADEITPTISNALKTGTTSGWKEALGGVAGGMAIGTGIGTAIGGDQMASTIGSAVGSVAGAAIGMAFGVPMVGGLIGGALGGTAGGLFSSGSKEEEKKKVASGYNVGYANGHATSYGVDFYNTGVEYSGPSDPDVQRKIADSFRYTAEALQDFAEELGFAVDVLEGFEMPNMNVTDDQLDGYIRNGENMMAFKGLMEAGLRGAFDAVARDGEVYVDEYERLATSLSTVRGGLEAYGYELSDVAMITQENIDALRVKNTEVAEGTAAAMTAMATSMGATSDVLAQITADSTHAAAALSVTDEQLSSILEADYASDLLDAVGGEEAFNSMMTNLTKNIFDTIGAYAENLDYYTNKATSAISKLDEAGVTVDNFWEKFDAAIKQGLTVDEFEAWSKASTWVNQIDTVTQAMQDWADGMTKMGQALEVRKLTALGQEDLAKYTQALYAAEWELAEARKAGYDATVIAMMEEVQALELARQEHELSRKKWTATQDLNVREKELNNDPYAEAAQAYYDNGWELQEAMESGLYSKSDLARLKDIQEREIQAYYDEVAESVAQNSEDARARLMRAMGDDDGADLYEAQINAERELKEARDSGLYTLEAYATLSAALDQEIKNLIELQKDEFVWTERELQARLLSATGHQNEATVLTNLIAAEKELAEAREAGYDAATIMLLEIVQAAEAAKVAADQMSQSIAELADLKSREYAATGDDTMSSWTTLLEQQRQERYDALSNGKDQDYMRELMRVQGLERTSEWEDLQEAEYQEMLSEWRESQQEAIDAMNDQLDDLTDSLGDLKDALSDAVDSLNEAMDSINDIISVMLSNANSIYSRAASTADSIRSTVDDIMNGQDSILSPSQKAASLKGQIDTAYEQMTTAGHGAARVEAASTISGLASEYLSALQSSTDSEKYMTEYLEMMTKLREAESISGLEENYQARIVDALEEEQRILNLIRTELAKDDPNTTKLQALAAASGVMGTALEGIYGDTEAAGSWRDSVEGLLASAGYSNADIIAALGGNVGSQSFLAQLNDFNTRVLNTQLPFIAKTIGEIKGIEDSIRLLTIEIAGMQKDGDGDDPPGIEPPPVEKYTEQQKAWASNLSTAMNDQSYGGKTNWTANTILPDLDFYKQWGSSYGISDTAGYKVANNMVGEYLRVKTRDLNAENAGGRGDWTAVQAKTAIGSQLGYFNGDPNVLAHWLAYGYAEGYDFPTTAPIAYKTADYFRDKWEKNHSGADSPYMLAKLIAGDPGINIGFANDVLTLEAIAKKHYDTYIKGRDSSSLDPADRGLVQPYALGGFASAGSWGLVGEEGPEIVKFKSPTTITSNTASKNLLGDSFDELKDEVKRLRTELYAICRENAANTLRLAKMADRWSEEGLKTREVSA